MSLDAVNDKLKEIVGEGGSIVNTLAKLAEKVQESYGAIEAKEGVLPSNKNTQNLPDTIAQFVEES